MVKREIYRDGRVVISPSSTKSVSITDQTGRVITSLNMIVNYDRKNKRFNIVSKSLDDEYTYIPKELVNVYYPDLDVQLEDIFVVHKRKREGMEEKIYEIQGNIEIRPRSDLRLSAFEQKEEMKVYETPYKIISKFIEDVIDLYRGYFLRNIGTSIDYFNVFKALKKEDAEVLLNLAQKSENIEEFFSKIPNLSEPLKGIAVKMFAEKEHYEKLKKTASKLIEAVSIYNTIKELSHREFFPYIEKEWEKIKNYVRKLEEPPKVVIYDPQAGSGEAMLRAFDEYNVPGKLVGTEIRDIQNNDSRYNVITNVDSILFSDMIVKKIEFGNFEDVKIDNLSSREKNQAIRGIFSGIRFINPPYDTRHVYVSETLRETWAVFTNNKVYRGITFGLLSHSHKNRLGIEDLKGVAYEIPSEDTGYTDNNVPEKFIYVRGSVSDKGSEIKIKEGRIDNLPNINIDVSDEVKAELDRIVEEATVSYKHVEEINRRLKETYDSYIASLPKSKEELFNKYSLKTKALRNEPVFPALNLVKGGLLTFEEVRLNNELHSIYRDYFPKLYKLFLNVAKEKGYSIETGNIKEIYSAVPFENLGVMKYKYVPFIIPINDEIKNVLEELVNLRNVEGEEEKEKETALNLIGNIPKDTLVWIKADVQPVNTGMVGYGYVSKLTLSDKTGKTLAVLEVDIKEFYDRCVDRGIIKPNVKHISEHPEYKKVLKKMLDVFSRENAKPDNLFIQNEIEYIDRRLSELKREGKQTKEAINIVSAEIYRKWREEGRVLTERILNVNVVKDAHAVVYSKLKAMGIDEKKIKDVLKELENLDKIYKKNHVKFLENLISVNEEFKVQELQGKTVKEYLEEVLLKIIGDKNIVSEVQQDVLSAYVNLSQIDTAGIYSTAKLVYTYLYSKHIQTYIQKDDIDTAYKLFEDLHLNKLGLKPHQFYVPLNNVILSELTDTKKAVYGWEMRTGKTLASVFHLYLNSLVDKEQRPGMFEVRSANVFDISNQILSYLPYIGTKMAIFPNEADTNIKQKFSVLTPNCIPNVFFNTKLFKGKGNTVERLLQNNPFLYIEEKADSLTEANMKEIERRAKGKVFEKLLYVPEFKREYLYAVVDYLIGIENDIEKNQREWDKFIQNLGKYSEGIKDIKNVNLRDYRLLLVSKDTHHLRFNYKLTFNEKLLSNFSNTSIYSNAEADLKTFALSKDIPDHGYYVVDYDRIAKFIGEDETYNIIPIGAIAGFNLGLIEKTKLFEYEFMKDTSELDILNNYTFKDGPVMTISNFVNSLVDKKNLKRCLGVNEDIINGHLYLPIPLPVVKREKKNQIVYLYPENTEGFSLTEIKINSDKEKLNKIITYEYDINDPNVKPIIETTRTNKSPVVYSLSTPNMLSCVNKDEADQSSNIFSTDNKITSYMSQVVGKTSIISGTLTSGDISSLVSFLSIGHSLEDTAKLTNIAETYFDIYEVSDNFNSVFRILVEYVMKNKDNKEELNNISKALMFEDSKYILSYLEDADIPYSDKLNLRNYRTVLEKSYKDKIKFTNVLNAISTKLLKMNTFDGELFIKTLMETLKEKGLIKKGIGTTNLSFSKIIPNDVSASLLVSEDLTGIKRIIDRSPVEEFTYKNIETYFKSKNLSHLKGKIEEFTLGDVEPMTPMDDEVVKSVFDNPSSLQSLTVISNNEVYSEIYTSYKLFMQVVKAVEKELLERPEFVDVVSKSGKTTSDSLFDLVREALIGSEIQVDEEEESDEIATDVEEAENVKETVEVVNLEDKKVFAYEVIKAIQNLQYGINAEDNTITFKLKIKGKEIEVKDNLSLYDENLLEYIQKAIQNRYKAVINLFSGRPVEEEIFKEKRDIVYPFDYNLIESKDKEVIETTVNAGLLFDVVSKIKEGKSFAILPSRVHLSNLAIADVLSEVLRSKKEGGIKKPVQLIVRVTDKKIKEFLNKIDIEGLREKGIIVKAYNNQALVDAELLSLKDKEIKDKVQTILISPAQSTSRGVDLSMLDGIVFYGILANAREFMQAIQRLHNPAKFEEENGQKVSKAKLTLYGTGFIEVADKIIPTYTNIIAYKNEEKKRFSDAVMSGSLSPVIDITKIVSYMEENINNVIQQDVSLRVA